MFDTSRSRRRKGAEASRLATCPRPLTPTLSPAAGEREEIRVSQRDSRDGGRLENSVNDFPLPIRWGKGHGENASTAAVAPCALGPDRRHSCRRDLARLRRRQECRRSRWAVHGESGFPSSDAHRGHEPTNDNCGLREVRNYPRCHLVRGRSQPPILDAHGRHEPAASGASFQARAVITCRTMGELGSSPHLSARGKGLQRWNSSALP